MLQEDKLYSFGRPTYGRLGREDVGASSDDAVPEAKPVDNLDGVSVAGMAAGTYYMHFFSLCIDGVCYVKTITGMAAGTYYVHSFQ